MTLENMAVVLRTRFETGLKRAMRRSTQRLKPGGSPSPPGFPGDGRSPQHGREDV